MEKMLDLDNKTFVQFFRALANEERIEIIKLLIKNNELAAQDVEKHFYLEQSTTSHHLNTLKRVGVLKSRKEGRHILYSINSESFIKSWEIFENHIVKNNMQE